MKIGFIGGGAMCEALVKAMLASAVAAPEDIYVSDHKQERCDYLHATYQVKASVGASGFAKRVGILFLAVKPQVVDAAMHEVSHEVHGGTIIASIVAGLTLARIQAQFQIQPVIRIMPNTPMLVGAAPFGVIFGALAVSAGLSAWGALALSGVVFAGSSQFVAVSLMAAGAALPVIWLTTLVVNLRHALYSAALLPHAQGLSARWRWCLAFWLTDETFAVVEHRLRTQGMGADGQWFWLGSSLAMYLNWLGWTLVGVVLGQNIPGLESWGLDFAMAATFTAIVTPQLARRPVLAAAVCAGVTALLARGLPYKLGLMLAAAAGVLGGMLAERGLAKQELPS